MCCFTHHLGVAEPDERLRCTCTVNENAVPIGDPAARRRCIRRATEEDFKCDVCSGRKRSEVYMAEMMTAGLVTPRHSV